MNKKKTYDIIYAMCLVHAFYLKHMVLINERENKNELVNRVYCLRMIELVDYQQAVNTSDRVSFAHAVLTNGKIL